MTFFSKIKHSILTKFLITTVISVITINYILLFYLSFKFNINQRFFINNTLNYVTYLIDDIEKNPTPEKFDRIKEKFRLEIIKIPDFERRPQRPGTGPAPGSMEKHHMLRFLENPDIIMQTQRVIVYNNQKRMFINIKHNNNVYKISYIDPPPFMARDTFSTIIFISISIVIVLTFLYIKSLLKPLKDLNNGIEKISSGNLNYEVPVYRKDELGFLAESFNNMNSKIKTMINSKEQLLFDVSHELRTPLTRIKLALALMNETNFSKSISDDVDELEIMINEILETARAGQYEEKLELEQYKLSDLVKTALKYLKIKKSQFELIINNDFEIPADRKKMITVLKNIIENSEKYSNTEKFPITIIIETKENQNICSISDKGVGIPEKDLKYVFEPFYRVDKARTSKKGGFGLGLHLCKKIIDLHNFKIQIQSIENEGTSVIIYF
ncbi:MAG: HAMP domain-containing histidine kinase [Spirochaetes bacterium]|nr:HAMP domain-containing histidine kinase [Spirochaetota bacterium]